jgi:hypothetical protein
MPRLKPGGAVMNFVLFAWPNGVAYPPLSDTRGVVLHCGQFASSPCVSTQLNATMMTQELSYWCETRPTRRRGD